MSEANQKLAARIARDLFTVDGRLGADIVLRTAEMRPMEVRTEGFCASRVAAILDEAADSGSNLVGQAPLWRPAPEPVTVFGIPLVTDPTVPEGELHVRSNGRYAGKVFCCRGEAPAILSALSRLRKELAGTLTFHESDTAIADSLRAYRESLQW